MARKAGSDHRQMSLFDVIVNNQQNSFTCPPGSLNLHSELSQAASLDLKECPLSRWQVAGSMSELTGTEITKSMLDSWTAESKEGHRMPAVFVPAFCIMTKSTRTLEVMTRHVGVFVLPGADALRSEVRHIDEEIELLKAEKKKRVLYLKDAEAQEGKR